MIQVGSGNPVLKGNIGGLESAGGLLGWLVGYPLAALFSSVGAFILFILLTVFSALVMSGKTVAEIRELLEQYRTADSDEASHGAGGSGDSLARRLLGRARRGSGRADASEGDPDQTALLDSYDGDEPFRSALEVEEPASRKRGSGRRKRSADREAQQTAITDLFEPGGDPDGHSENAAFVIPDVGEESDTVASSVPSAASPTRSRPAGPTGGPAVAGSAAGGQRKPSSPKRSAPQSPSGFDAVTEETPRFRSRSPTSPTRSP